MCGGTTVIIGCPAATFPVVNGPQVGHQKRLDTVKETLAAEGVKGHSRFYGRVIKNCKKPEGFENFFVEKTAHLFGWKMMEHEDICFCF